MQTKSGFSHPGIRIEGSGGSHRRALASAEVGVRGASTALYVSGEGFREDGWRDRSDSRAASLFAKGSWIGTRSTVDLSVTTARTRLRGNGAVPVELLAQDRSAVFTYPDETTNRMAMLTLQGGRRLSDRVTLSGTVYGRFTDADTFNGDDSDYGRCPDGVAIVGFVDPSDALCFGVEDDDDDPPRQVFGATGRPVAATDAVLTGTQNTTDTRQHAAGATMQVTWDAPILRGSSRLIGGLGADAGWADFASRTELARLTADRGTQGSGRFDRESVTEVDTRSRTVSTFVVSAVSPVDAVTITVAGRYNRTDVSLDDRLGTALNGDHAFDRVNPSVGASVRLRPGLTAFAGWSTSNRAPTPVELTCADPDDPCRLPNGFQADPPLRQVVATTVNVGMRSSRGGVHGSVSVFRTDAADDIYFVSAGPARNSGFFTNIGTTRRQGIEATAHGVHRRVYWSVGYTWLDAIFASDLTVSAPNHPLADDGEIDVASGDRLPLTPRHLAKASATVDVTRRWRGGASVILQGRRFVRGDESNQLDALDAFAVVDVQSRFRILGGLAAVVKVSNLFDAMYETAGLLGEPDEVDAFEDFENPRFVTPGAPRFVRVGVTYQF